MFKLNLTEALERPILTYNLIYARTGTLVDPYQPCLMEAKEFLKLFEHIYQLKIPRRNLQLYSSPAYRFIPLPVHKGGYKSYYLNPEHTVSLAVAVHLQRKHYFPVQAIQKVMKDFPEDHYHYILQNTLKGEDILDFAYMVKEGFDIKDVLYRQVSRVLEDIEEPYWTAVAKFGKGADEEHEEYVAKVLLKENQRLATWLKSGGLHRAEMASGKRSDKEAEEFSVWLRAIRDKKERKA